MSNPPPPQPPSKKDQIKNPDIGCTIIWAGWSSSHIPDNCFCRFACIHFLNEQNYSRFI